MGIKMNRFLYAKREQARSENRLADWAWVKGQWRPVQSYRTVTKGKKKSWVEVTLFDPLGRKKVVPKHHVKYKENQIIS